MARNDFSRPPPPPHTHSRRFRLCRSLLLMLAPGACTRPTPCTALARAMPQPALPWHSPVYPALSWVSFNLGLVLFISVNCLALFYGICNTFPCSVWLCNVLPRCIMRQCIDRNNYLLLITGLLLTFRSPHCIKQKPLNSSEYAEHFSSS